MLPSGTWLVFAESENTAAGVENTKRNILVTDKAFFVENMTSSGSLLGLQTFPVLYSASKTFQEFQMWDKIPGAGTV